MNRDPASSPSRSTDQRRTRRTKVFLVVEVGVGDALRRRAHVLDISTHGARIHARSAAGKGGQIDLIVAGRRQSASIMWVDHPTFGIRFAAPLSAERLQRILTND